VLFVDEVHLLALSASYRSQFVDIGRRLRWFGAPIVSLTATARVAMQNVILRHIYGGQPVNLIRQSCSRKNLLYQVQRATALPNAPANARHSARLQQFAQLVQATMSDPAWSAGRVIIFARTRSLCSELHEALRRQMPSEEFLVYTGEQTAATRQEVLSRFMDPAQKVRCLIGTGDAIGVGLDSPLVNVVIHYGLASTSLEAFHQQAGRGARPGSGFNVGLSLVFYVPEEQQEYLRLLSLDLTTEAVLAEELRLDSPLKAAQQMQEYCELRAPDCRPRWLLVALDGAPKGGVRALSCLEAASKQVNLEVRWCDLCTVGREAHSSCQAAAREAAEDIVAQQATEETLRRATPVIDGLLHYPARHRVCLLCCLAAGKLVPYSCMHSTQAKWHRCFQCGGLGCSGKDCPILQEVRPKSTSPLSRCYKCLQLRSVCTHGSDKCTQNFYSTGVVAVALELLKTPDGADQHPLLPPLSTEVQRLFNSCNWTNKDHRKSVIQELLKTVDERSARICWGQEILATLARKLNLLS
jgi:hypothetical protein